MSQVFWRCVVAVGIIVSCVLDRHSTAQVQPDLGLLAAKAITALNDAKSAYDDLNAVTEVVKTIEQGKQLTVKDNKWSDLATKYRVAAKALAEAPLPTDFDSTKYVFSLAQLQNCDTRGASLQKASAYLTELKAASDRGKTAMQRTDAMLVQATQAQATLRYLIEVHAKLIAVPIYGEIFKWDWLALQTDVSASLGQLSSATKAHRKKLDDAVNQIGKFIPNMEGNLAGLQKLSCSLAGWWKGTTSANGVTFPVEILVTDTNGVWTGQINLNGGGDDLHNLMVNGRSISFSVGQGASLMNFTGTISTDGSTLAGSFSPPAGGKFSMSRQPS